MMRRGCLAGMLAWTVLSFASAHPVPSFTYDRTIQVRLTRDGVEVAYRLELLEFTALRDIGEILDSPELSKIRSGNQLRDAFVSAIAPLLADRIEAFQDERSLTFRSIRQSWFVDENLKCDFVLRADWPSEIKSGNRFRLSLIKPVQAETIHLEKGRIDLAFAEEHSWRLTKRVEPEGALKDRPETERTSAEDRQLRAIEATIESREDSQPVETPGPAAPQGNDTAVEQLRKRGLVSLLDSRLGVGVLLVLSGLFGAAHALTPGHGKTLVAAYLVGQRGTVAHAFFLGVVTTLTHTGVVIVLAAILPWLLSHMAPERIQTILGFVGGLLIAGLGIWLLLRRLSGQADHVHVGGGHHHHHGSHHHHHHHHWPTGERVRIRDLVVLGVSGGIVPCWDAIALLAMAIGTRQLWLGLPLLLAFSAGLAGVLVLIGVLVVKVKSFGASKFGEGRVVKALPIVSALAVTLLGVWLCFDSVR